MCYQPIGRIDTGAREVQAELPMRRRNSLRKRSLHRASRKNLCPGHCECAWVNGSTSPHIRRVSENRVEIPKGFKRFEKLSLVQNFSAVCGCVSVLMSPAPTPIASVGRRKDETAEFLEICRSEIGAGRSKYFFCVARRFSTTTEGVKK